MDPYKIHGLISDVDYGSSDSGESDFDEEYWRMKPPPLKLSEHNIMVIMPRVKQKRVADKKRERVNYSTVLGNNISKNKLADKYHTADEYGIVTSYTRTRNFFSVLELTDPEVSGFKENVKSTTAINTQHFFDAQSGMNSSTKKKRRDRKQRRQRNKVKDTITNTLHSDNIENISNDSVQLAKMEAHLRSLGAPDDYSKRKRKRRRRRSTRVQSNLLVPKYTSMSFENVENTTTTKTFQSISVPLKNESELKNSLTKTFQKVGLSNNCTITRMVPPQFSEQNNSLNVLKYQLPSTFQEKINYVVEHKNVPEIKAKGTFFNALEFHSEDIEDIYNDDSFNFNELEREVIQIKHTPNAPNAYISKHFGNTITNTLQEPGGTNHSNATDDFLALPLSKVQYENMLKYTNKSLSPMSNIVQELSSERCCPGTFDLSECVSGFPMPEESPSYFKQIFKYLYSNQNAIIIGLIVWYFLKQRNVGNIHSSRM